MAIPPAALASPVEDDLLNAARSTTGTVGTVQQTVVPTLDGQVSRLRSVVDDAAGPVRAVADALRQPVSGISETARQAPATVSDTVEAASASRDSRGSSTSAAAGGSRTAGGSRASGGIGDASLQHGAAASIEFALTTATGTLPGADALASDAPEVRNATSPFGAAAADDAGDDSPLAGPTGGGSLLAPVGIALLSMAALLGFLIFAVPRFLAYVLRMSPARRGLVAFLSPIERPG